MKLPRKWLDVKWVENFCSVKQDQGPAIYNTDAIDKADLLLWIRKHRLPQTMPKDFRYALKQMCRNQVGAHVYAYVYVYVCVSFE
jgi:hypothetical protein